jgi:hypothetical protein
MTSSRQCCRIFWRRTGGDADSAARLLESEGTTFTDYVLAQRLALAQSRQP